MEAVRVSADPPMPYPSSSLWRPSASPPSLVYPPPLLTRRSQPQEPRRGLDIHRRNLLQTPATIHTLKHLHTPTPRPAHDEPPIIRTSKHHPPYMLQPGPDLRHIPDPAVRAAADREIGLLHQVVGPMARQRDPDASARAEEQLREMAGLSLRLHALLIRAGLRDGLPR